jgi:hypothetical protein
MIVSLLLPVNGAVYSQPPPPRSKHVCTALITKKIKFSLYFRKFRMEQLQSHLWLTASLNIGKYFHISSYIRKPFLIYDFATAPL